MSVQAGPSQPAPEANGQLGAPTAPDDAHEDAAAESDDSQVTQPPDPPEMILADAEAYRERKIQLGGRPTRPIGEYRQEDSRLIPMSDDHPRANDHLGLPRTPIKRLIPFEVRQYESWCMDESSHFRSEMFAWESFLRSIWRDWNARNEAAGGNVPPPPPVLEWDPLDLHTRYLDFLLQIKEKDEKSGVRKSDLIRFRFRYYFYFLEHIKAVERQVAEMREQHGVQGQQSTEGAETKGSPSSQPNPESSPRGGKRARDDDPGESTAVRERTRSESQHRSPHPPKRRRLRGPTHQDDTQDRKPTPSSASRAPEGRILRSRPQAAPKSKPPGAEPAAPTHGGDAAPPKRRGRRAAKAAQGQEKADSEVPPAAEPTSGKSKPGPRPKQRGRKPKPNKAQQALVAKPAKSSGGPPAGKRAGAAGRQRQTDPPAAGVRRSARIAAAKAKAKA